MKINEKDRKSLVSDIDYMVNMLLKMKRKIASGCGDMPMFICVLSQQDGMQSDNSVTSAISHSDAEFASMFNDSVSDFLLGQED